MNLQNSIIGEALTTYESLILLMYAQKCGLGSTTQANVVSRHLKIHASGPNATFYSHPQRHFTAARCLQTFNRLRAEAMDVRGLMRSRLLEIQASLQDVQSQLSQLLALESSLADGLHASAIMEHWNSLIPPQSIFADSEERGEDGPGDAREDYGDDPEDPEDGEEGEDDGDGERRRRDRRRHDPHASPFDAGQKKLAHDRRSKLLADPESPSAAADSTPHRRGNLRSSRSDLSSSGAHHAAPSSSSSSCSLLPHQSSAEGAPTLLQTPPAEPPKRRGRPAKRVRSDDEEEAEAPEVKQELLRRSPIPSLAAPKPPPLSDEEHVAALKRVWRALWNNRDSSVFRYPVTPEEAPDYDEMVFQRMDLETMKKKISPEYSVIEFYRDFILMVTNAIIYNAVDSDVYNMSIALKKFGKREFSQLFALSDPDQFPIVHRNSILKNNTGRSTRSNFN